MAKGFSSDLGLARQTFPSLPVSVQWGLHALPRLPLGVALSASEALIPLITLLELGSMFYPQAHLYLPGVFPLARLL